MNKQSDESLRAIVNGGWSVGGIIGRELATELIALRELKGEQVPVAWTDAEELRDMAKNGCGYLFKVDPANPFTDPRRQIMLYDRPQKPIESDQVPVAVVELNDALTVAEIRGDVPRRKAVRELYEGALVVGQELFTAQQKPVVSLGHIKISEVVAAVSLEQNRKWNGRVGYMAGWNACIDAAIEAAGCIVKTATEKQCCEKCGGSGAYHCPQMLGTVECECGIVKDGE